jgi:hypothetical protein
LTPSPASPSPSPADGSQPARERGPDGKFKPKADDKPAEGEPPQAAHDYSGLVLPEQFQFIDGLVDEAKKAFAEDGLPPDKAQRYLNLHAQAVAAGLQQERQMQLAWQAENRGDPEIGGNRWKATETKLAKVRNLGGAEFAKAAEGQAIFDHPAVVRWMLALHDRGAVSEDTFVSGSKAPSAGMAATLYPNTPQMRD